MKSVALVCKPFERLNGKFIASSDWRTLGYSTFALWRFAVQNCANGIFRYDSFWKGRSYSSVQMSEKDELVPRNVFVRSIASIIQKTERWGSLLKELCVVSESEITPPIAVQVLKRIKKPEVAFEFFRWLDDYEGFKHDSLSYSAVIKVLTKDHNPSHAAIADSLLRKKLDLGLGVTQPDYDHVLYLWARSRRSDVALSLLDEMIAHGFSPSVISCKVLLEDLFLSKCGDLAWELFNRVLSREINVAHPEIFNVAMKSLCVKGKVEEALKLLTKMKAEDCNPNLETFNILIKGCSEKGEVKILCELFKGMLDDHVKPDSYTMNLLIKELCKQGKPEYGNHLFNHMRRVGWIDRKFVYTQLVESLCNYGWWLKALKIFVKMLRKGHHPKPGLYNNLVRRLCMGGRLKEAFKLKDLTLTKGFLPDIAAYNGLINGLSLSGRMDLVDEVLVEIHGEGLELDAQTYNIVLRGYCLSRSAKAALEWVKRMKDEGSKLDMESCDILVNFLAAEGRHDEALQVKKYVRGRAPPVKQRNSCVDE